MSKQSNSINPDTGRQYCLGGCLPSEKPSSLPEFSASAKYMSAELPPSVDLRELMTPPEDQSDSHSCVGNALAGAYEFLIKKNIGKHIDVSRLFIYYNSRINDGFKQYKMADAGTFIEHAIDALAEFGCCKEQSFPFDMTNLNREPPQECYAEAKNYRIKEGTQLRANLKEMKACLAEGYPFVFGLKTYESFYEAGTNGGRVPMPNLDPDSQDKPQGGHAMIAAGYSDRSKCFIVKNSWGEKWGADGYCYIPYEYMCDSSLCSDLHSIKTITDDAPHHHQTQDDQWFWKQNDPHDYYHSIWKNKSIEKEELVGMTKHLGSDPRVHINFQETFALATDYIEKNIDKIKSLPQSSIFQIICRGYYQSENKNAMDLLPFLNHHQLEYIPIVVITGNKSGVLHHFKQKAPSIGIQDWKSRIYVTDNHANLITKINANLINKYSNQRH